MCASAAAPVVGGVGAALGSGSDSGSASGSGSASTSSSTESSHNGSGIGSGSSDGAGSSLPRTDQCCEVRALVALWSHAVVGVAMEVGKINMIWLVNSMIEGERAEEEEAGQVRIKSEADVEAVNGVDGSGSSGSRALMMMIDDDATDDDEMVAPKAAMTASVNRRSVFGNDKRGVVTMFREWFTVCGQSESICLALHNILFRERTNLILVLVLFR